MPGDAASRCIPTTRRPTGSGRTAASARRASLTDGASLPTGRKLKRYEIKYGNSFPTGRSYAAEMQNFANWYQYYRKRRLMLAAAMGQTLENLTGMRLGIMPFNDLATVTMYDADATSDSANRRRVAGLVLRKPRTADGTPTRPTLKCIGDQYNAPTEPASTTSCSTPASATTSSS